MQRKETTEEYTSFTKDTLEDSPQLEAKNQKNRNALLWKLNLKEWLLCLNYFSSPEKNDIIAELTKAIKEAPPNSSFDEIFNRWETKEHITPNAKTSITNFHFLAKPRLRNKESTNSEDFIKGLKDTFKGTRI